jgi:hypothetical protein
MVVMTLQTIEFTGADINYSFYVSRIVVWKLQFLSHLSISFLSVDIKQYGARGLVRFPFAIF